MSSKQIRSGAKAPGHRRHIVGRLMGYIKRGYKARFIIVLVCILVSAIANVAGSLFLGSLIDDYITPLLGAADPDFSGLVRALVMMGCLFLVGALCAYAYNRNMIVVSQGVQKTIRDDLFGHMQTLPIKYFDTHAHGDVMSVYTNDVDTLRQMFAQSIPQVINSSMTILVTFLGMLFTNALLTVVVLVCVCFALVVTRFLAGRSGRYFLRQQSTLGALNGYIEEMINGQKVVKVFCHEQEAQDGFDRVNDEMFHSADKAHTYASILMPIMVNIGNVQYVIVAMVGGALALSGVDTTITLGVIASFLQLSKSFSNPINQISQQFNSIIMALAGAERIFALMDEEPEEDHGTVTLVNVSYDKEGHQLEESEKRTNLWAWRVPHSTDMVMVPVREEADGSFTELKAPEAGKDEAWAWKYQEHGKAFYRPILGPVRNVESEDYYLIKLSGDVRFDHVDFAYEEGKTILHDISLFAKPGQKLVSGAFLMCFKDHVAVFSDCAINLNPDAEQLSEIALQSAETARAFGIDPKVGMLSYSTLGSGKGPDVDMVEEATKLLKEKAPDLPVVGSIQFDAAWSPTVAATKAKGNDVAGHVNGFVFPDLCAGNIGYKAVQRSSGALAIGPVLQGLNKPVNDLSRGALVQDIINTIALTAIEAQ